MFNETKIKCFLSLAKTLNFTTTANLLFMSQQAVSKNISSLEDDFGFKLFIRSSHSVELTKEGESCNELISQISEKFNATVAEIRYNYNYASNAIKIGYQSYLDFGSIPNRINNELQKDFPDLKIDVYRCTPSLLAERIMDHQLDLIFINGRFAPKLDDFRSIELAKTQLAVMISADNPMLTEDVTYNAFLKEPFIVDCFENESSSDFNKRVQQEVDAWGLSPSRIIWVPDRDTAYTYAEMGHGIVIGTDMSRIARNRNLKSLPIGIHETLLAIWNKNEDNPMVEEYAKRLQNEYTTKPHQQLSVGRVLFENSLK